MKNEDIKATIQHLKKLVDKLDDHYEKVIAAELAKPKPEPAPEPEPDKTVLKTMQALKGVAGKLDNVYEDIIAQPQPPAPEPDNTVLKTVQAIKAVASKLDAVYEGILEQPAAEEKNQAVVRMLEALKGAIQRLDAVYGDIVANTPVEQPEVNNTVLDVLLRIKEIADALIAEKKGKEEASRADANEKVVATLSAIKGAVTKVTSEEEPVPAGLLESDLVAALKLHLKSLGELFDEPTLQEGVASALRELRWSTPVTRPFRIYWILERAKRACVSMMCLDTGYAFKFKQINLQHRFEHFLALVKEMDKQFAIAKREYPFEFVEDEDLTPEEKMSYFGDYHGSGFCHSLSGRF